MVDILTSFRGLAWDWDWKILSVMVFCQSLMYWLIFTQAVEGDCDVVLKNVGGTLSVTAFKCKTEGKAYRHCQPFQHARTYTYTTTTTWAYTQTLKPLFVWYIESTEDLCLGCPTLLPLNDTTALDMVHASLALYNNNSINATYMLLEVGRLTSQVSLNVSYFCNLKYKILFVAVSSQIFLNLFFQVVSGGPTYTAEFVIVEGNCTNDACEPLNDIMAVSTKGSSSYSCGNKINIFQFHLVNIHLIVTLTDLT